MECNREEAIKAKDLAEKKLLEVDSAGAKIFALKAQKLFPALDGLSELLTTLDVYVSAEKKINGLVDWYGVLGVQPSADDDAIRKQYRRLALSLHPDKNKSVGADGAFKILSEAWSLLSDKVKRYTYDQKRNARGIPTYIPVGKSTSSVSAGQNGVHNFNNIIPNGMHQNNAMFPRCTPLSRKHDTFWTACPACKIHFEYLTKYLNSKLHCINCLKPYYAVEAPAPRLGVDKSSELRTSFMQAKNFNPLGTERSGIHSTKTTLSGLFSKWGSHSNEPTPASSTAQVSGVTCSAKEKVNSGHAVDKIADVGEKIHQMKPPAAQMTGACFGTGPSNAGLSSVLRGHRPRKKRCINEQGMNNHDKERVNHIPMGYGSIGLSRPEKIDVGTSASSIPRVNRRNINVELSQLEVRYMLMDKAKKEILKKVEEWRTASTLDTEDQLKPVVMKSNAGYGNAAINSQKMNANEFSDSICTHTGVQAKKSDHVPVAEEADQMSMSVPDPDFHDFDRDRTERSFGDNQVWAAYDDDDGMPRYYAMIHRVISLKPFKMQISWLNTKSNHELGPLNWVGSGFYKTSGDFWVGKYGVNKSLNSFSHKVKWSKGRKGTIQIYPRKGDVWAVFKNWSCDWNELTPDEVIHKYDMVEIIEDYNEKAGVTVAPLVKVPGFKTVFQRHSDPRTTRTILREEMFRLSHQVPSYLLTGEEGNNAPKGCLELDPAATPLELLRVLTEAEVEEMEETARRAQIALDDFRRSAGDVGKTVIEDDENVVVEKVTAEAVGGKKPVMIVYRRKRRRVVTS